MSDSSNISSHERKSWIAKSLTHFYPGLGHLYCGQPLSALTILFTCTSGLFILMTALVFASTKVASWVLLSSVVLATVIWIYAALDIKRVVKRLKGEGGYQLQPYNKWWVYLLIAIQPIGFAVPIAFLVQRHLVEAYVMVGASMSPMFVEGDRILVDKRGGDFQRWDVVVFRCPGNRKQSYVQRIVGLPGETIRVDKKGEVFIDGQSLREQDPIDPLEQPSSKLAEIEIVVPTDQFFLLGDNRGKSRDSRHFGTVHIGDVQGPAAFIYYPWSRFEHLANNANAVKR